MSDRGTLFRRLQQVRVDGCDTAGDRHFTSDQMDYEFTAIRTSTYLHAIGAGPHTPDNLRQFLADTHRAVVAAQCRSVLLEVRFSGPSLDVGSLYAIIHEKSTVAALLKRIAYVDTNTTHLPERAEFAELAANKMGLNARMFPTVIDAERWLSASE